LNSSDPAKQQAAREKLDKAIGKDKREEIEQLQKDLQSTDKATREAAEKKVEELKKKAEEAAKKNGQDGKKADDLTPEEVADLVKKANDLNSKDEKARRAAEEALDEEIGKDAREKLQEELKKQPPMDPKQVDELAKKITAMARSEELRRRMEEQRRIDEDLRRREAEKAKEDPADPRNKAKTAELQLEEFEKHRGDRDLLERLKWTDEKMTEFLEAQRKRVEELQKEAAAFEDELRKNPPTTPGATIPADTGEGKLSYRPNATTSGGTTSGATFAPPGFDDAKKRFLEAAKKLDPKK
jgi:collagen type III alpha